MSYLFAAGLIATTYALFKLAVWLFEKIELGFGSLSKLNLNPDNAYKAGQEAVKKMLR